MAYELVEKQSRTASEEEQVTISSSGRHFMISAAAMTKYLGGADSVMIYVDRAAAGNEVRIALRPMNENGANSYSVTRPKASRSGYVVAKVTLAKLGYSHEGLYTRPAEWVERQINGKKIGLLEFGVERKYLKS